MLDAIKTIDRVLISSLQGLQKRSPQFDKAAAVLAAWPVYLIPVSLAIYWFWAPRWRGAEIRAVIAGLFAWQVANRILQALFERGRPVSASGVSELLFNRPTDSFPSNHAALGMAVFATLYLAGERTLCFVVLGLTLVFSLFRVVTGLHFPSDIVAGWLVGLGSALAANALRGPIDDYIARPIVRLAKTIRLG